MKKVTFSKILLSLSVVAISLAASSCIDPSYFPPGQQPAVNNNGAKFKLDLVRAIENSDRIVVLQHSHASDFVGTLPANVKAPYYDYGSRVLSDLAKSDFLSRVQNLSAYNSSSSNRPFESHHTIKFYSQGFLKSTMRVSFETNEVLWNGSRYSAPQDIVRAVGPVVANAGFRISRDWNGIAKIEYASGRKGSADSAEGSPSDRQGNDSSSVPPPIPSKPIVPTAKKVPGKPGMVFNPYTQNQVDVKDIPSGYTVRDPEDADESHLFKVP